MEYIARFPNEIISLFLFIVSLIVINIFLSIQKARVDFYRPEFRFLARSDEVNENYNQIWFIFVEKLWPMQEFFAWIQRSKISGEIVLNFEKIIKQDLGNGQEIFKALITERTKVSQRRFDFFYNWRMEGLFQTLYGFDKYRGRLEVLNEVKIRVHKNLDDFKYQLFKEDFVDDEEIVLFESNNALEVADFFADYYLKKLDLSWKNSDERKELSNRKEKT